MFTHKSESARGLLLLKVNEFSRSQAVMFSSKIGIISEKVLESTNRQLLTAELFVIINLMVVNGKQLINIL